MGVPAFFRYLQEKYPKILTKAIEEFPRNGVPVDASQPNPNGLEFDNLYLDMNGLIHPCTHPEGEEPPETEEDMYFVIFRYLDRIINLVRPRKVIYMAIDGVAPRAKMNQQRSRRFRSAQEAAEAEEDAERVRQEMIGMGIKPPSKKKPAWDSNVITPGTDFMATLSDWLRIYIAERLNNNPAFKNVRVILSDAQSPGEGEHKLMQFIRRQRAEPGYDPNTSHIMYGLDADLIMLGLASHEIYFTILREEVLFGRAAKQAELNKGRKDPVLLANGTVAGDDAVAAMQDAGMLGNANKKPYVLVKLWVLREYLRQEFREELFYQPLQIEYNFEACLDDFVFMCFFVGNDFLPHLPSLSIKEGGLELLLDLYRRVLPTLRGYLTTDGKVNLTRIDVFVGLLGEVEDEIFERRRRMEEADKKRKQQQAATRKAGGHNRAMANSVMGSAQSLTLTRRKSSEAPPPLMADNLVPLGRGRDRTKTVTSESSNTPAKIEAPNKEANKEAAEALRASLKRGASAIMESSDDDSEDDKKKKKKKKKKEKKSKKLKRDKDDTVKQESSDEEELELDGAPSAILKPLLKTTRRVDPEMRKGKSYEADDSEKAIKEFQLREKQLAEVRNFHENIEDEVRLGEEGWKDRYYASKFGKKYHDPKSAERKCIIEEYIKGLCWVMQYYYEGVQSWTWYYPYHYAPFASDLVNLDEIEVNFPPSKPFKPIDQLMGVFPPASAHALPEPCRWFMTDENSPIADFYPLDFKFDPNGKAVRWLWIALLPFIDEKRLLKVTRSLEDKFTKEAKERNSLHPDLVFSNVEAAGTKAMLNAADNLAKQKEARRLLLAAKGQQEDDGSDSDQEKIDSTPTTAGDARAGLKGDCGQLLLAQDTQGISGYFMHPSEKFRWNEGERIMPPSARAAPITHNKVVSFEFRLPKLRPHLSKVLAGVKMPKPELSLYDLDNIRAPKNRNAAQVGNILIERMGGHPMGHGMGHGMGRGRGNMRQQRGGHSMNFFSRDNSHFNGGGGGGYQNHQQRNQQHGHGGGRDYNADRRAHNVEGSYQQHQYHQQQYSGHNNNNNQHFRGGHQGHFGNRNDRYGNQGGGGGNYPPQQYQQGNGGYRGQHGYQQQHHHQQHQYGNNYNQHQRYPQQSQRGGYPSQGYVPQQQPRQFQQQQRAPARQFSSGPPPQHPRYQGNSSSAQGGSGAHGRNALMDSLASALKDRKGGPPQGRPPAGQPPPSQYRR